jgi:hypothetical protein
MPTKVNKPAAAPIIITITLPEEDKLLRTGQLLIQRGEQATLGQFEYSSLDDIMTAIERGTTRLMQVEENPPDLKPTAKQPQGMTSAAPSPAGQVTAEASTEQDPAADGTQEQAPADASPQPTLAPATQDNQPQLF